MMHSSNYITDQEACKHFKQIIKGCKVTIHMDHQNLVYDEARHGSMRVLRTCLLLDEEYGAKFVHIAGKANTGADGLSRLPMFDTTPANSKEHIFAISNLDRDINHLFPINMGLIQRKLDADLNKQLKSEKNKDLFDSIPIEDCTVHTYKNKVWVPATLQY